MYGWKAEEAKSEKPRPRLVGRMSHSVRIPSILVSVTSKTLTISACTTHLCPSPDLTLSCTNIYVRRSSASGAARGAWHVNHGARRFIATRMRIMRKYSDRYAR